MVSYKALNTAEKLYFKKIAKLLGFTPEDIEEAMK